MTLVSYQVLLPNKFWELAESKEELKQMIKQYFNSNYPNYRIQRVIRSGESYVAICEKEWGL
ncbi:MULTISPECIES: hypothetical protein [Bacillus cereus group]|uniref:hypothetical protein n=1 Tax=Bacillus cereus group TaxID=86661 RepID=UPI0009922323|nr:MULTISPECIES: hypothetical protein [Bacillus cereus group]MED1113392.1 hypothetical protein [Bacillus paramycoides]OOR56038.1 hypothetical protein BGP34_19925 [Bacillus mycoides]